MSYDCVFIGIDPTAGKRLHTLAVLDSRLKVVKLANLGFEELIKAVLAHPSAACGVDAPISVNKGLMADPDYRHRLGLERGASSYRTYRVAEFELRRRRLTLSPTPALKEEAPSWMQEGWRIYERLRQAGFVDYPRPGARRMFETFPHAGYAAILKRRPFSKTAIEGVLQRQLALYEEGLDIRDPMHVLEEWTRHRILLGDLSREKLYSHDQLDALMAAYTAYLAERQPDQVILLGDPAEGQIVLPVPEMLESY